MAMTVEELRTFVSKVVERSGYELVELELRREPVGRVLRLYIDVVGEGKAGVTLEDCSIVSREVGTELDVHDPIEGKYSLEVSSPGLDRPLRTERDFKRFAGKRAKIRCKVGPVSGEFAGRKNFTGTVLGAGDDIVRLTLDDKREVSIDLADVDKANIQPTW